jgi:hypothetical protein
VSVVATAFDDTRDPSGFISGLSRFKIGDGLSEALVVVLGWVRFQQGFGHGSTPP